MMKTGITYNEKLNPELLAENGFDGVGADCEKKAQPGEGAAVLAVRVPWKVLNDIALPSGGESLVVDTCGLSEAEDAEQLEKLLRKRAPECAEAGLTVCIENGVKRRNGCFYRGIYDNGKILAEVVDRLNHETQSHIFAAAFNTGYSTLLGQNTPDELEALGERLKVLYVSDNDGERDYRQLPYTFTKGRGILSTDWTGIIRSLFTISFDGILIADIDGTLNNTPEQLLPVMLELVRGMIRHWEEQIHLGEVFSDKGKTLILFGAGNMFRNYMRLWGKSAPPAFLVDNNRAVWGERRQGIEIRSPESILEIPPEKRNVWICNMHYKEIQRQLQDMGIASRRLKEWYFVRNPWESI